ncbi:ArsR family transcriptional regulator [Geobacter sp.]|uniref:VpaChn25_0724 family phage protein n=1 Tax=Geobacter sp. TaxID=46610 RepID=UPI0026369312|nr:ArsR family transcriptional regulator [Geobacter sp.]
MSFRELVIADIRLVILRALEQDLGYSHNESILHSVLEKFGHKCSRDQVRTELAWLQEQGLVTLETVADIFVATITQRGADVATGRTVVPGVKRPNPRG